MLVRLGSQLDFLELNLDLFFLGFLLLLALLIFVFAVIHDPADRRYRGRGDLDQIQVLAFGKGQCLVKRKYAELLAVRTDDPDFPGADGLINVYSGFRYDSTSYLKRFTSCSINSISSASFIAGRLLPSRNLGVTVSVATSLSPMTNMYGVL